MRSYKHQAPEKKDSQSSKVRSVSNSGTFATIADPRKDTVQRRKLIDHIQHSPRVTQLRQQQEMMNTRSCAQQSLCPIRAGSSVGNPQRMPISALANPLGSLGIFQLKPLDEEIDPDKLNVVGERHDESDRRGALEKKYAMEVFNGEEHYWEEHDIYHDFGDEASHKVKYGDPIYLAFLNTLTAIMVFAKEKDFDNMIAYHNHAKDGFKMLSRDKPRRYKKTNWLDDKTLMKKLDQLMSHAAKARATKKTKFESYYEKIVRHLTNSIKKTISNYVLLQDILKDAKEVGFTSSALHNIAYYRSLGMQDFAQRVGNKKTGIWKVGNDHIAHIQDIEDRKSGKASSYNRRYNLLSKEIFDSIINLYERK